MATTSASTEMNVATTNALHTTHEVNMYALYDCLGNEVGRYKTERGLKCAITRNRLKLWVLFDQTKPENRKEDNLLWYTRLLEIKA